MLRFFWWFKMYRSICTNCGVIYHYNYLPDSFHMLIGREIGNISCYGCLAKRKITFPDKEFFDFDLVFRDMVQEKLVPYQSYKFKLNVYCKKYKKWLADSSKTSIPYTKTQEIRQQLRDAKRRKREERMASK